METTVTKRGQTVVPAEIRRRHGISTGHRLFWLDDGRTIKVVPVPEDPLASLRGRGRGEGLAEKLLSDRLEDKRRDG